VRARWQFENYDFSQSRPLDCLNHAASNWTMTKGFASTGSTTWPAIYQFIWDEFDWYLEIARYRSRQGNDAQSAPRATLIPYVRRHFAAGALMIPFITEELWQGRLWPVGWTFHRHRALSAKPARKIDSLAGSAS
jgi:hypothetical protein